MAEYIEREGVLERMEKRLEQLRKEFGDHDHYTDGFEEGCVAVEDAETADVVEVVRCKDCTLHGHCITEDHFRFARVEDPYCCVGKGKNHETDRCRRT